jgi:hypothetical protein
MDFLALVKEQSNNSKTFINSEVIEEHFDLVSEVNEALLENNSSF